ncbi:Hypothetical protein NTJ_01493 [Nesidiocoris tenuis]|uniref:Uncharacterized protein n=1 Tax=Nesidiocoris tenuis TaxID=355587 RepID=A0ABN7A8Q1_9HEMI|nr:Hypothetical protein NTJ_01493 [Nesidiocoris tenuis]
MVPTLQDVDCVWRCYRDCPHFQIFLYWEWGRFASTAPCAGWGLPSRVRPELGGLRSSSRLLENKHCCRRERTVHFHWRYKTVRLREAFDCLFGAVLFVVLRP